MNRLLRIVYLWVLLCTFIQQSDAQRYPITGNVVVLPPYSPYLTDMTNSIPDRINLSLLLLDANEPLEQIGLRLKINGPGISLETKPTFRPSPIDLSYNIPTQLSGFELAEYFDPQNLRIEGLGLFQRTQFLNNPTLPEGLYTMCFEAFDYRRFDEAPASAEICFMFTIMIHEPPIIITPIGEQAPTDPQNLMFTWIPQHVGNFITNYTLYLYERTNPNDAPINVINGGGILIDSFQTAINSYNYTGVDPLLEYGAEYVIRVRAFDINGGQIFDNLGYSPIEMFTYGGDCTAPFDLQGTPTESGEILLTWEGELPDINPGNGGSQTQTAASNTIGRTSTGGGTTPANNSPLGGVSVGNTSNPISGGLNPISTSPTSGSSSSSSGNTSGQFIIEYRNINSASGDWLRAYTFENTYTIPGMEMGQSYEVRVGLLCWGSIEIWSDIIEVQMPDFYCGIQPPSHDLTNSLLNSLVSGDSVYAGDFKVIINEVYGGSSGRFTGTGYIRVPYLNFARINVDFIAATFNDEYRLVDGFFDVKGIGAQGLGGDWLNWLDMLLEAVETLDDFLDLESMISGQISELITFANTFMPPDIAQQLQDAQDALDNATTDQEIQDAMDDLNDAIDAFNEAMEELLNASYVVFFENNGQSKYGHDSKASGTNEIATNYEDAFTIGGKGGNDSVSYTPDWKSVKTGDVESLKAVLDRELSNLSLWPNNTTFKTLDGTILPSSIYPDEDSISITINGSTHENVVDVFAVENYTDADGNPLQHIAGKMKVLTLDPIEKKVWIVPVNGAEYPSDPAAVEASLNKTFGGAAVNWAVQQINGFTSTFDDLMETESSGFWSNYSDEMKLIRSDFRSNNYNIDEDEDYIIFICKETDATNKYGYMPRGAHFGFLFKNTIGTDEKLFHKFFSHEIAHGAFNLKHTYDEHGGQQPQESTENLMDTKIHGTALRKWQWMHIHNPQGGAGLFSDDEDSEGVGLSALFFGKVDYTYEGTENFYTVVAPDGDLYALPKDAVASFKASDPTPDPTDTDAYPKGSLAGYKIGNTIYHGWFNSSENKFLGYATASYNGDKVKKDGEFMASFQVPANDDIVYAAFFKSTNPCVIRTVWGDLNRPTYSLTENKTIATSTVLVEDGNWDDKEDKTVNQGECSYLNKIAFEFYKQHRGNDEAINAEIIAIADIINNMSESMYSTYVRDAFRQMNEYETAIYEIDNSSDISYYTDFKNALNYFHNSNSDLVDALAAEVAAGGDAGNFLKLLFKIPFAYQQSVSVEDRIFILDKLSRIKLRNNYFSLDQVMNAGEPLTINLIGSTPLQQIPALFAGLRKEKRIERLYGEMNDAWGPDNWTLFIQVIKKLVYMNHGINPTTFNSFEGAVAAAKIAEECTYSVVFGSQFDTWLLDFRTTLEAEFNSQSKIKWNNKYCAEAGFFDYDLIRACVPNVFELFNPNLTDPFELVSITYADDLSFLETCPGGECSGNTYLIPGIELKYLADKDANQTLKEEITLLADVAFCLIGVTELRAALAAGNRLRIVLAGVELASTVVGPFLTAPGLAPWVNDNFGPDAAKVLQGLQAVNMVVGIASGLGNGAIQVMSVDDMAKGVAAVEKIQDVGKLSDMPGLSAGAKISDEAKEVIKNAKHRMESELVRNGKQTELTSARAALGLSDLASLLSRIFDNLSTASKSVYTWLDDLRNTNKIKFKKTSETKVDIEYIDASGGKHKVGELVDNGDNVPSSLVHEQNGITNYNKNDLKQAFDNLDDANPATSGIACKNGSCGLIPGGCFIKGTLVKTPNGYANIEDLKLGDEVISYNHLKKSSRVSKVKNRFERVGTRFGKLWAKNKSIESTLDHPFYVPQLDKYLRLDSLKKGMQVLALSGLLVSIDSIEVINKVENVYNLTIENDQNYFIGEAEILAHNLSSCLFKYVGINDNMLSGLNAVQKADLLKDIKASASLRLHFKSLGEADLIADIRAYKKLHKYPTLRGKPNNLSKTRQWDDITFYELDDAITLRPGLISEFENNASLFRHFEGMNSPMEFWYKYGLLREHLVSSNSFSLPTNFKATLDDIEIPVGAVDFPIPNGGSRLGDLPQGNAYSDLGKALEGELNNIIGPQNAFNAGNISNLPLPPAIKSNLQSLYDDGYRVVLQQQLNINSVNPIPDYLFVKVDNFGVADLTQPIRYIDAKLNINTSFSGAQAQLKTNYTAINNGTMPCTVGTTPNGPQLPGFTSGQTVTFVEISKWGTKLNNGRIDFTKLVVKP